MNGTPSLHLLTIFATVAEHASFSKAARKLGLGKGTVSRSIAQLEDMLGVELLHRTTRSVALSTAGAALFERTGQHLSALQKAIVDLPERDEAPSGLLRMAAPLDVGTIMLPPVLAAFSRRYPAVRFDIRLGAGRLDLVKEGFDLAIRVPVGPLRDPSLTVRRLGRIAGAFYASPLYLARRGKPKHIGDERHTWVMHHAMLRLMKISADRPRFVVDDFLLTRELVRDGVGVGLLPTFVAKNDETDGLLDEVKGIAGHLPMAGDHVLVYPSHGHPPKKVTAFRDFLVDAMRSGLR